MTIIISTLIHISTHILTLTLTLTLKVQRVFSMPLKDRLSGNVFGVVNFINKCENDIFTTGDELLIKVSSLSPSLSVSLSLSSSLALKV
jgi:hypothetical protein